MPKKIPKDKLNNILSIIKQQAKPLALEQIMQLLGQKFPRRTLQRWIGRLVATGQLQMVGARKSTRYFTPTILYRAEQKDIQLAINESGDIQRYLQQPLRGRSSVGYNREFLDRYSPNETTYLSEIIRKHLWEIGASQQPERPAGTYAREILSRLLIDLSWNSSRLEGNTYSLLETERLLSVGETAENKSSFETQMILNHKNAIEFLVDTVNEIAFNRFTILNLHALLADNLLADSEACGRLRTIIVAIHGTVFRPLDVPQLINECFQQILDKAAAINDPFEQAFFLMVQLPYLQPFEDVNKRVSRLAANIPFIKHNLSPLSFIDVSDQAYIDSMLSIYELNRVELLRDLFIWAYERSALRYSAVQHSLGEPDPFRLRYRLKMVEIIGLIVKKAMDKKTAAAFIQQQAFVYIAAEDRARYIEVIETELLGLHAGNIARYRIRLAEFELWQKNWQ